MKYQFIIYLIFLFGVNVSCQEHHPDITADFERKQGPPVEGIRIAWDYSSMQKLSPRGDRTLPWTGYPRVRRLQNGSLLSVYEAEGNVELIRSYDNGSTWSSPALVFEKHEASASNGASAVVNKANGELLQLANGDLVAACNYRPHENGIAPFSIAVKRSHDNGQTWSDAEVIYEAGRDFGDGCWEPAFLQLPSGELQVYFANENPYRNSDEQEISMLASEDNGVTWREDHITVSFREDRRDGMPVPLLVGDKVLMSIEDNGHGQFKPWIVRNPVDDLWSSPVRGNSSLREYALVKDLSPDVYAGAPYLMKVPSGEVILSYQTNEDRSPNWELSTMEVAISDTTGRNFSKYTHPFDVPLDSEAKWNSISRWDETTIVAASTISFRSEACEVWMVLGNIIPEMKAEKKSVSIDGRLETDEWGHELPVFVGHKGIANARAGVKRDDEHLFVGVRVKSDNPDSSRDFPEDNEISIFLDAGDFNLTRPDSGLYRFSWTPGGGPDVSAGEKGAWQKMDQGQIQMEVRDLPDADGYFLEWGIPFSDIAYRVGNDVRINLQLQYQNGKNEKIKEDIVHATGGASHTWCRISMD